MRWRLGGGVHGSLMVFHVGRIVAKRLASPTVTILELQVPTLVSFHPGQWVDFVAPPHDWVDVSLMSHDIKHGRTPIFSFQVANPLSLFFTFPSFSVVHSSSTKETVEARSFSYSR